MKVDIIKIEPAAQRGYPSLIWRSRERRVKDNHWSEICSARSSHHRLAAEGLKASKVNRMHKTYKFTATIEKADRGGAYVVVPLDVEGVFGKKRLKVKASIDGETYQGSLVRMGGTDHILGILKSIRQKIGKSFGDEVEIVIEEDTAPREVQVPQDMQNAFKTNPKAERFFNQLSYTNQKEYVWWIEQAKRDETRQRRLSEAIQLLEQQKNSNG